MPESRQPTGNQSKEGFENSVFGNNGVRNKEKDDNEEGYEDNSNENDDEEDYDDCVGSDRLTATNSSDSWK